MSTTLISSYSFGNESDLDQSPTLFSMNSKTVFVLKIIPSKTIRITGGTIAPAMGRAA